MGQPPANGRRHRAEEEKWSERGTIEHRARARTTEPCLFRCLSRVLGPNASDTCQKSECSLSACVVASSLAIPLTSRRKQTQGGSRCSVERFGVMLSRGARWNQLWGDLGRFIAVQALPSPVIRKSVHLARARAALPRQTASDCQTCVPALYFLGCGEARLAECGEVAESHRAGADRRHGKFQVPSIPLLAPLSKNDTHVKIGWRYCLTDLPAATGDNLPVTEVRLVRLEGQLAVSSLARHPVAQCVKSRSRVRSTCWITTGTMHANSQVHMLHTVRISYFCVNDETLDSRPCISRS
jgi:hypothetical protein